MSTQTAIFLLLTLERETVELCSVILTSLSVAVTVTHLLAWEPWESGIIPMDQSLELGAMDKTSTLTEDPVLCV